ncbi:unnamed protein product [Boreogadus saida]
MVGTREVAVLVAGVMRESGALRVNREMAATRLTDLFTKIHTHGSRQRQQHPVRLGRDAFDWRPQFGSNCVAELGARSGGTPQMHPSVIAVYNSRGLWRGVEAVRRQGIIIGGFLKLDPLVSADL